MVQLTRGGLLRAGAVGAAVGAAGLAGVDRASASTSPIDGFVYDEGGQVFDVRDTNFGGGAAGDGTTDDTVAIVDAIAAAAAVGGTVLVPPGIYLIKGASNTQSGGGPIRVSTQGGLKGAGGNPGTAGAATVFLCGDSTAGIQVGGPGVYQGFCCDGNNGTASTPLQQGTLSGGDATTAGSHDTFIDVWVTASSADGWTIYGSQSSSYHHCGSTGNARDGVYIDGGAGELDFWNWSTSGNGRYGVHGDAAVTGVTGTYVDHCENVHFWAGAIGAIADSGTSAIYLRKAVGWKFHDATIRGDGLSGPAVDLDQSHGYALDFGSCRIAAGSAGTSPGIACIQVGGTPPTGLPTGIHQQTYLVTDTCRFLGGDNSVYFLGAGGYLYSALDWISDKTSHGPVSGTGVQDVGTLLWGRGSVSWTTPSFLNSWSGTGVGYRIDEIGHVQLKGSVSGGTSGAAMFTLPAGYRPGGGSGATMMFLASPPGTGTPVPSASVTVDSSGNVKGTTATGATTVYLDSIRFPVD